MKQHVTVVPSDRLIIVDGASLRFAFDTPADLHALQWHEGRGEMEWTDDINHPLTPADYADDVAPFVALWETEKARLDAEANRPPTLERPRRSPRSGSHSPSLKPAATSPPPLVFGLTPRVGASKTSRV